jgi:hypothetical protein
VGSLGESVDLEWMIGLGVLLLPFGLRILYVEKSRMRNGVSVMASCVDRIYEGNSAQPQRIVCVYVTPQGRELRWVLSAEPDFPEVGDVVPVIYDVRMGGAERRTGKRGPVTLGVGWTALSVLLLAAGLLHTYVL